MTGKDLNKELSCFIQSCKNEGILGYIDQVLKTEDENDPKFVSNLMKFYTDEAAKDITQITLVLSKFEVNNADFAEVKYRADAVRDLNYVYFSSKGVHNASIELAAAAVAKNKAECLEKLEVLDSANLILKEKLTQIAEIKKAIIEKSKNDKKV